MKQSMSAHLPKLSELTDYKQFINQNFSNSKKLVAYCGSENLPFLREKLDPKQNTVIMIGPEGDFTEQEYQAALNQGFEGISLGKSRLRTETAGIFCCLGHNFVRN